MKMDLSILEVEENDFEPIYTDITNLLCKKYGKAFVINFV